MTRISKDQIDIPGGTTGQALVKLSGTDFDYDWGTIIGGGGGGTKLEIQTTQINSQNGFGSPDTYTVNIPGGTLSTNNAIKFKVFINYTDFDGGGDYIGARMVYGGSAFTDVQINIPVGIQANGGGFIEGWIVADGSTGAQKGMLTIQAQEGTITATTEIAEQTKYDTVAVDSTIDQNLEVQLLTGTNCQVQAEVIVVEQVTTGNGSVKFGGDGSDGALAISSGTTTIDLLGARVVVLNYTSIAITGTGVLDFTNPHAAGTVVIIKSQGNVTLTSSATPMIDMSGCGGAGGATVTRSSAGVTGGNNGTNGTTDYTYFITNFGLPPGGGSTGGAGGASLTSTLAYKTLNTINATKYPFTFVGAGGGSGAANFVSGNDGGDPVSGAGGNGGGGLIIECRGAWNFTTANGISVAGEVGGVGVLPPGGVNRRLAGTGGGGGGGGYCIVLYNTLTANTGTIDISGGAGGLGTGDDSGGTATFPGGAGGAGGLSAGSNGTNGASGVAGDGGAGGNGFSLVAENTDFA